MHDDRGRKWHDSDASMSPSVGEDRFVEVPPPCWLSGVWVVRAEVLAAVQYLGTLLDFRDTRTVSPPAESTHSPVADSGDQTSPGAIEECSLRPDRFITSQKSAPPQFMIIMMPPLSNSHCGESVVSLLFSHRIEKQSYVSRLSCFARRGETRVHFACKGSCYASPLPPSPPPWTRFITLTSVHSTHMIHWSIQIALIAINHDRDSFPRSRAE
jgi:hypothetical protein